MACELYLNKAAFFFKEKKGGIRKGNLGGEEGEENFRQRKWQLQTNKAVKGQICSFP